MRKIVCFLLLFPLALACRDPLLDGVPRYMREQGRFPREGREDKEDPQEPGAPETPGYVPSVYATALHFRDSADWRKDSLGMADLLFFKDEKLVLTLPVESPPDPECHRIWGGHLWTDFTDGRETVLFRDGREAFRFDGEERLRGFLVQNGKVHTLGQRPGRDGFCYRINGEAVFDSPRGSVLGSPSDPEWPEGALTLDGEDVYYCYGVPITLKDRIVREYHVMRGSLPFKTIPAGTSDILYDLRISGGQVVRVERQGSSLYWIEGDTQRPLNVPYADVVSCKLVRFSQSVSVRGTSHTGLTSCLNWYFIPPVNFFQAVVTGQSERGQLVLRDGGWAFADTAPDGRVLRLVWGHGGPDLPEGDYRLATPRDLFVSGEYAAVALTGQGGESHVIVSDRGKMHYSFNGYFTSVRIE